MNELCKKEIEKVTGAECTYASVSYKTGDTITNSNGNKQICQADGSWSQPE